MKKLFVSFAVAAAMTVASAASSHNITLFQDSTVNGQKLKAGEYRLMVDSGKATISKGKQRVEVPVKVETAPAKFGATSVRYLTGNGDYKISEIRVGGSSMKLVVEGSGAAAAE